MKKLVKLFFIIIFTILLFGRLAHVLAADERTSRGVRIEMTFNGSARVRK